MDILLQLFALVLLAAALGLAYLRFIQPHSARLDPQQHGAMLLTIAAGCAYSRRFAGVARLMLTMLTTYAIGLSAASLWILLGGKPLKPVYFVVFGLIFLVSAVLLVVGRHAPQGAQTG